VLKRITCFLRHNEQLHDAVTNLTLMIQLIGTLTISSNLDDFCGALKCLFYSVTYRRIIDYLVIISIQIQHFLQVTIYIYMYINKYIIITYNDTQTCSKLPICFFFGQLVGGIQQCKIEVATSVISVQ
jgi:hypothetical protein